MRQAGLPGDRLSHPNIKKMQLFFFILLFFLNLFNRLTNIPPAAVKITPVQSVESKPDSTFLIIKIYENKYAVSLFGDSITTSNVNTLDNFISKNISKINNQKIFVVGQADVPYDQFRKLKNILKKHEYYKFRITTTE